MEFVLNDRVQNKRWHHAIMAMPYTVVFLLFLRVRCETQTNTSQQNNIHEKDAALRRLHERNVAVVVERSRRGRLLRRTIVGTPSNPRTNEQKREYRITRRGYFCDIQQQDTSVWLCVKVVSA